jgi:hypothetical protein
LNHWSNLVQLGMKRESPGMQTGLGAEVARVSRAPCTVHGTMQARIAISCCPRCHIMHGATCTVPCTTPAVHAECRLDKPFLPNAGVEAVRAGSTAALEVGVAHRVEVPVLVDTEVVVGHVEREHRR